MRIFLKTIGVAGFAVMLIFLFVFLPTVRVGGKGGGGWGLFFTVDWQPNAYFMALFCTLFAMHALMTVRRRWFRAQRMPGWLLLSMALGALGTFCVFYFLGPDSIRAFAKFFG